MKTFIFLACVLGVVYTYSEPRRCSAIGKGHMCGEYLLGYYECDGSNPFGKFHQCDPDDMCSCGLNKKCDPTKPKCIRRPHIPSLPQNFIVSFHGRIDITHQHGSIEEKIKGYVFQDSTEGHEKMLKRTFYSHDGQRTKTVSKLVIKDEKQHSFVQYTETKYPDGTSHCSSRPLYRFRDLFHDLRLLSYKKSEQVYEYTDGPMHAGDGTVTESWKFGRTHHSQLAPKYYHRLEKGSQHTKVTRSVKLEYTYFHNYRPHASFFTIPQSCKNQQQHQLPQQFDNDKELDEPKDDDDDDEEDEEEDREDDLSSLEDLLLNKKDSSEKFRKDESEKGLSNLEQELDDAL